MNHNLDIPERLHTPLKIATMLSFLGSAQEQDIPLATDVVPTDAKTLAAALTVGFGCDFGGFVQPDTETWKELKHLEGVVSELLLREDVQDVQIRSTRRPDPWACPRRERPLEDVVREKRDAIFKQMVGKLDIWGNPIDEALQDTKNPRVPIASISKVDYFGDHPPSLPALALAIAKSKFSKFDRSETSLRDVYLEICEASPSPEEMFALGVLEGLDVDRVLAYAEPTDRGGICGIFDVLAIEQELQAGE